MILRRRNAPHDPRGAALDVVAAARFLAAAGVGPPRIWVDRSDDDPDPRRHAAVRAWSHGVAVVPVGSREARDAAIATATAIGATLIDARMLAGGDGPGPFDGKRFAARHALALYPDDVVELVLGDAATTDLETRLADFDARSAAEPTVRRRLILADLPIAGPQISPALVSAIVHPLVLVDLRRPEARLIGLAKAAADEVIASVVPA